MAKKEVVTDDIYRIFDTAGLDAASIYNTRVSGVKTINAIRTRAATRIAEYIVEREEKLKNKEAK